jgi:hypothetical protein
MGCAHCLPADESPRIFARLNRSIQRIRIIGRYIGRTHFSCGVAKRSPLEVKLKFRSAYGW